METLQDIAAKSVKDWWNDAIDVWHHHRMKFVYWFLVSFIAGGIPLWINYVWGRPHNLGLWTNVDNQRILFFTITAISSALTYILQYKGDLYKDMLRVLHVLFWIVTTVAALGVGLFSGEIACDEIVKFRIESLAVFFVTIILLFVLQVIKMSDASGFLDDKKSSETRFAKQTS